MRRRPDERQRRRGHHRQRDPHRPDRSHDAFKLVGNPFTEEPYGIGLKKGDNEFRNFINDVLEEAFEDGPWAEAWDRTAGTITGTEAPEPPAVDRY